MPNKLRQVKIADIPLKLRQRAYHQLIRQGENPDEIATAAFWPTDTRHYVTDRAYKKALAQQ